MGCCLTTCQSNFHFMCARAQNCVFQLDRKIYCFKHRDLVSAKVWTQSPPKLIFYFFIFIIFTNAHLTSADCLYIILTYGLPYSSSQMVSGKGFEVPRRVYVDFEGINLRRKFLTGLEPELINMTIGKNIWLLSVVVGLNHLTHKGITY